MTCGLHGPWVPAGFGASRAVLRARHNSLWDRRLWKSFCCLPIPWLGREDPHVENYRGIMEWGLFSEDNADSEARKRLRGRCVRSLRLGSAGSGITAQPAQPPSQAPGSQPRKRQDVSFWALNSSVPGQVLLIPRLPPLSKGSSRTALRSLSLPSPHRCPALSQCPHHHQRR